jgi:hypothetical protein
VAGLVHATNLDAHQRFPPGLAVTSTFMHGPVPVPPKPHVPLGLAPILGYVATREPQPLEDRSPVEPEWWEEDEYAEEWHSGHSTLVKATAVLVSASLVLAGVGTVLEIILSAR